VWTRSGLAKNAFLGMTKNSCSRPKLMIISLTGILRVYSNFLASLFITASLFLKMVLSSSASPE